MNNLLPPNATPQEVALEGATSRISDIPVPLSDTYTPAAYGSALLPWLAWAFSVDEWNPAWTDAQKRQAIANSAFVHRHKGTIGALRTALDALGYDLSIKEWFAKLPTAGPAYTFTLQIIIDQVGIPDVSQYDTIVSVANAVKNVRSSMIAVDVLGKKAGDIYLSGVAICGETVSITSEA